MRVFWVILDQQKEYVFVSISRLLFLMIFGSKCGCQGSEKQAFGVEGIAKIKFRRNWISYDCRVDFSLIWVALGPIFMAFVALETGSKIDRSTIGLETGHSRSDNCFENNKMKQAN